MGDEKAMRPRVQLLFTEAEWNAALPKITDSMTTYMKKYRTPVFIDHGDHGEPWGSGSFVELGGRKYLLTNEHVAVARRRGLSLGVRFDEADDLLCLVGDHSEMPWPWDLALIPISDTGWTAFTHCSSAIQLDQIAFAHMPSEGEIFAFAGYAGERTEFWYGTMIFGATSSLSKEADVPKHPDVDARFHFALSYRPDRAIAVVGAHGLPEPHGLSGSVVWNTGFVEAKIRGIEWTPDLAQVTGVVWGWPSSDGSIVATRSEHLRSFLLAAAQNQAAMVGPL